MSTLMRPFGALDWLQRQLDTAFDEAFSGPQSARTPWVPTADVAKTADAVVYSFDLPGMKESDVSLEVQNGMLVISGERHHEKEEQHEGYFLRERAEGTFTRSFSLPRSVRPDDITASFENGVLKVRVPLPEETKPKRIPLTTTGAKELSASAS